MKKNNTKRNIVFSIIIIGLITILLVDPITYYYWEMDYIINKKDKFQFGCQIADEQTLSIKEELNYKGNIIKIDSIDFDKGSFIISIENNMGYFKGVLFSQDNQFSDCERKEIGEVFVMVDGKEYSCKRLMKQVKEGKKYTYEYDISSVDKLNQENFCVNLKNFHLISYERRK